MEEPKLSYISTLFRVKLTLPHKACQELEEPPADILARAEARLEKVTSENAIEIFEIYEDEFHNTWNAYREMQSPPFDHLVMIIGEGCPHLSGIAVKPCDTQDGIIKLTIDEEPSYLRLLRLEWIVCYANHYLREKGLKEKVNTAQVHGAWLRAIGGESIIDLPIGARPEVGGSTKPYSIFANRPRRELTVVLNDLTASLKGLDPTHFMRTISDAAQKVSYQWHMELQVLKSELLASLETAIQGPEVIGVNLPLVLLAAVPSLESRAKQMPSYPGAGRLNIKVADDKLLATVEEFDMKVYAAKDFKADEDWLRKEVKRYGISDEASIEHFDGLANVLLTRGSLEGMVVAEGIEGIPGTEPFLEVAYRSKQGKNVHTEDEIVDLRSMQQMDFVKGGQLIAQLSYKNEPVNGRDVFGNPAIPPHGEELVINAKEGVIEKEPGKFYAEFDGMPVIDENSISLSKVMIHRGDVNLKSGNISFDGPVEILGSIDSGAYVETQSDLKVKGTILGAVVRAKGNIEVSEGINTGKGGVVTAGGKLTAEFIENSRIQCGGSVIAKRAIINSDVIAGENIEVTDRMTGVVAGGNVSCRKNIQTSNLGFKNGALTKLNVGVDWKSEMAVRIRKNRLENINDTMTNDRQVLRELVSRPKHQKTSKLLKRIEYYQKRLVKERVLIEKLHKLIAEFQAKLTYNPDSKILVSKTIYANVDIQIGGGPVGIKHDMAAVAILARRKHGTKVVPLEVGLALLDKEDTE